jgi:hypothetical protein
MSTRVQATVRSDLRRRAQARATELGISFAEYVRRLLDQDLGKVRREADISLVFDLVTGGPPTNVARDKDQMLAAASRGEHLRSVGRRARARFGFKKRDWQ